MAFLAAVHALWGHFLSQNWKATLSPDGWFFPLHCSSPTAHRCCRTVNSTTVPSPATWSDRWGKAAWPCLLQPLPLSSPARHLNARPLHLPVGWPKCQCRGYTGKTSLKVPCSRMDPLTWSRALPSPLPTAWAGKGQHRALSTALKLGEVRQVLIPAAPQRAALHKLHHLQELMAGLGRASPTNTQRRLPGVCRPAEGLSCGRIFLPPTNFY